MATWQGLALGIHLTLTRTTDGGRLGPITIAPEKRAFYRPNWGLPTMDASKCEQTAGWVYRLSSSTIAPGESGHAVIVPPYPDLVQRWRDEATPGSTLPMYEGSRVCGTGTVLWVDDVSHPLSEADEARLDGWLRTQGT